MNALTAGTRGFIVSLSATLALGGVVVAGQHLAAGLGDDGASSVADVLPQAETAADVTEAAADDVGAEVEEQTVGEVVSALAADGVTETLDVYLSRDPFQPVVVQASATDGGGSTDGGSTDGGSTDGGTTGGSDDGLACSGSGDEAVCAGTVVTMIGFTDAGDALIVVDSTRYEVGTGDEFASSFRVERLDESSGCAFLRYGDEAFTICTGATVLK